MTLSVPAALELCTHTCSLGRREGKQLELSGKQATPPASHNFEETHTARWLAS
jgi:hypothetical protein